jgi:hypothetical protein
VFVIYDVSKSNFGLNPLHCFRLSAKAIESLEKNATATITDKISLVQEKIRSQNLAIADLFEEIPIRVERKHIT